MKTMPAAKPGRIFSVKIKEHKHSKDLEGNEHAGKVLGPFLCSGRRQGVVSAGDRKFFTEQFEILA